MAVESNGYNGRSGHDDSRTSDLAVLDANEYKNKRRLERLLDALDNIPDQADRAREQYNQGVISMDARRIAVQDAVNDAIWEAWNLLREHEERCRRRAAKATIDYAKEQDQEFDADTWRADDIDVSTLRETYRITGFWPHSGYFTGHPDRGMLGAIPQVNEDDIEVWGLAEFYALDEVWSETWTELEKPFDLPAREADRHVTHTVPRDLSWAAAVRLKEFLNDEHDMEIQFEAIDDSRPYDDWREEFESGEYQGPESVDLPHNNV